MVNFMCQVVGGPPLTSWRHSEKELPPTPRKRQFCQLQAWTATSTPPWVSSSPDDPVKLGLASLHNCVSQFLMNERTPLASWLYYSDLPPPPNSSEVGGDYLAKLKLWIFALKSQIVFLLNTESPDTDKGAKTGEMIWGRGGGEEFHNPCPNPWFRIYC